MSSQKPVWDILSEDQLKETLALQERLLQIDRREQAQGDFLDFVRLIWEDFIEGRHHKIFAEKLQAVADGKIKRLIVNMPPRHTKSEFASYLFPAWLIGKKPDLKIIQTTHTAELAVRFGRKMRNLMDSMEYKDLFPKVTLRADNKSAGRWETEEGGEYFAVGTGGAVTGRGADLLIIDDVHSEQDALSPSALEQAYDWYLSGPRQRLQPGGAIVIVMTRWSTKDLTGRLLSKQTGEYSDKWEVVEFPAIFPETGNPLWGEFWKKEELLAVKESLSVSHWNAQWMQQPTSEEGAIIKREWWRSWEGETIPPVEYIIQSYDTAFLKKESADYSAITTWGIFYPNEDEGASLILMDAKRGRWEFPELKKIAAKEYRYWDPEMVIIEAKASGLPLTHELRQIGIPVVNFSPSRGNDKHARVNAVAPMFESGQVWAPINFKFSEEVIEECAAFPFGDHDDFVDSTTQALLRFRQGGYLPLPSDYKEDELPPQARTYY